MYRPDWDRGVGGGGGGGGHPLPISIPLKERLKNGDKSAWMGEGREGA